ncbi:hypothetical protein [Anoxynatronum buryatiense]|uniref:hypothetical protein n=1 Tax=Anoxynatronum buryatiense TaxID=489973 RepID=UPI0024B6D63F|nr:hypothetical protein [Anoxynatronum buryatiense]
MQLSSLEVTPIDLFTIIPANFFTPITSKHKQIYVDCLELIDDSYKSELSFGVDKEVIVSKLEDYFDLLGYQIVE